MAPVRGYAKEYLFRMRCTTEVPDTKEPVKKKIIARKKIKKNDNNIQETNLIIFFLTEPAAPGEKTP
jgi:hypothetical protein